MKALRNAILAHKLAVTKGTLFSIITLSMTWQTATDGEDLSKYTGWEWLNLAISVITLWGNQMLAFLDKTIARLTAGKPAIETGNTEILSKQPENG